MSENVGKKGPKSQEIAMPDETPTNVAAPPQNEEEIKAAPRKTLKNKLGEAAEDLSNFSYEFLQMKQLSLITLYGAKQASLQKLIAGCQNRISAALGDKFSPYEIQQVHGTIVSLERASGKCNLNFAQFRNQFKQMDFEGLLHFIREGGVLPFHIQIAGFANRDYSFISRGKRPYERSFTIQGDKAVLMGWPIRALSSTIAASERADQSWESRIYPNILDDMRRAAQTYNILHSYHRNSSDIDNDYYLRLGIIDSLPVNSPLQKSLEESLRDYLAAMPPVIVEISVKDVYVAAYEDNRLPCNSTSIWPIHNDKVTGDFMWALFD